MLQLGSLWVIDATHLPWGCSVRLHRSTCWPIPQHDLHRRGLPSGARYENFIRFSTSSVISFGLQGVDWPNNGEIDIIEAVNDMGNNQFALHTTEGCWLPDYSWQSGNTISKDCSKGSGCVVAVTEPNSYNSGFAAAGGGVYALQLDAAGILCVHDAS